MHVPWWCKDWEMMIICDRVGWTAPPFCSTFCIWNVNCRLLVYRKCKGYEHLGCGSHCSTQTSAPAAAECQALSLGAAKTGHTWPDLHPSLDPTSVLWYHSSGVSFSLRFVTLLLPKEGNNWVWNKPVSAYANDFFTIASVRWCCSFFLNGYSGVTQQLKGKTFKYLMSLNCSKTEIIVFLQLWVT